MTKFIKNGMRVPFEEYRQVDVLEMFKHIFSLGINQPRLLEHERFSYFIRVLALSNTYSQKAFISGLNAYVQNVFEESAEDCNHLARVITDIYIFLLEKKHCNISDIKIIPQEISDDEDEGMYTHRVDLCVSIMGKINAKGWDRNVTRGFFENELEGIINHFGLYEIKPELKETIIELIKQTLYEIFAEEARTKFQEPYRTTLNIDEIKITSKYTAELGEAMINVLMTTINSKVI